MSFNCTAAHLPFGAAQAKLRALLLCMLLAVIGLFATASTEGQTSSNTCASCHADLVKQLGGSPHGALAAHADGGVACSTCHGDGKAHAGNNGDITLIQNPARLTARQVDSLCLNCHAGRHPGFARSAHATANVGCVSCHSIHEGKAGKLLKAPQPALCYQCHSAVKSQFAEPVHHKLDEGTMACTACHNPHEASEPRVQASIARQDSTCLKCHTNQAGPFKFVHGAIRQEGCTACHSPHGGKNPKLLKQARINTICLECHLPVATVSDAEVNAAHVPNSAKPCTDCHTAIHGSNHDRRFIAP